VIRIDDEGPGIPEDQMETVFDPFYRIETSRSRETGGTGLGLTVARTIVRAHVGEIHLENRADGGLRVEVILPR
jgi:signal transduction histidine kinase